MLGNGKINAGEIIIVLDGKSITLRPTMRAADIISGALGGFEGARLALTNQTRSAYVTVIRVGSNMREQDASRLPDMLYRNGMNFELLMPLLHYLAILNNGGKPLPPHQARMYDIIEGEGSIQDPAQIEHDIDGSMNYEGNG
jgi:hypothetical protein